MMAESRNRLKQRAFQRSSRGSVPAIMCLSPPSTKMRDYRDTLDGDQEARDVFLMALLEEGIYLRPDERW